MRCFKVVAILWVMIFLSACSEDAVFQTVEYNDQKRVAVLNALEKEYDEKLLEEQIAEITKKRKENWSVYVYVPGTEFELEINNRQVTAASEIKLFNMATLYNEVKKENVIMDDALEKEVHEMITISSNTASNEVVKAIGGQDFFEGAKLVTEFAHSIGCTDTKEEHMLFNEVAFVTGRNTTSVKDCGQLLKKIYFRDCVSLKYDEQMLEMLKQQTRRLKIPAGVPDGVVVANKTGENSRVEFDSAIVFSPNCDYIISVCATNLKGVDVYGTFAEISNAVYQFFNADVV